MVPKSKYTGWFLIGEIKTLKYGVKVLFRKTFSLQSFPTKLEDKIHAGGSMSAHVERCREAKEEPSLQKLIILDN